MGAPSDQILKDLLKHHENQHQWLAKSNEPSRSWLSKKRHQLRAKINQSWETFEEISKCFSPSKPGETSYIHAFVPLGLLFFILVFGIWAPWYINIPAWLALPLSAWGLLETNIAYHHLKNEKNYALQWGDCAMFEDSNGVQTTQTILDKNKYLALLRAAGRKHHYLSEISQKLIDTVDNTFPYNAHQIATVLEKQYKVDGWSVLETHPNLMVEVGREIKKSACGVYPNNKIMKI